MLNILHKRNFDAQIRNIFLFLCFSITILKNYSKAQELAPQTGLHYYALENLDLQPAERTTTVRRGTAGSQGVAFDQLIVAPRTNYKLWILQAETLNIGTVEFKSPGSGRRFTIPNIRIGTSLAPDDDNDSLDNDAEFIMGTFVNNTDSDDDGIFDGAEVRQGTNPLENLIAATGVIGSTETPGTSVDVTAFDDVVVVADSDRGVMVFNIFNGMDPVIIAQVDTPGTAQSVSLSGNFLAVADGLRGLAVIDISDPPASRIIYQLELGSAARSVVADAGLAYVGLTSGQLIVVELQSGTISNQLNVGDGIQDLSIEGDTLFVLLSKELFSYNIARGGLEFLDKINISTQAPERITNRKRLFVGGNIAYVTASSGYETFDTGNPASLQRIGSIGNNGFTSFKQIISNGSGRGIAAIGVNPRNDGTHNISLYDVSDPARTTEFLATFETPGTTRALSIYNGLAYAVNTESGLQIINYLAFDREGNPPTIILETSAIDGKIEEGQILRITANVTDDVQVRNVEFYVDGVKVVTDGNFPFEHRFIAPGIAQQENVIVQARASDTGGNATWTDEIAITLVEDATSPNIIKSLPADGIITGNLKLLTVFFNEPIDPLSVNNNSFILIEAGTDGMFDTNDDNAFTEGVFDVREEVSGIFMSVTQGLPEGHYRATLNSGIKDISGNTLDSEFSWIFTVFSIANDRDGDGIPDLLEIALNLNPDDQDTDDNDIFDGQEDFDNDGLSNFIEVLLATDLKNPDSDNDGIKDGLEDNDSDGISDGEEIVAGVDGFVTNPHEGDSDGDGFGDGDEVQHGSDPTDNVTLPIDPNAMLITEVSGQTFSILNRVDPRLTLPPDQVTEITEVEALPFSILNIVDPRETLPPGSITNINEVTGLPFSILNRVDPRLTLPPEQVTEITEVEALPFSILNVVDPRETLPPGSITDINEVEGLPFSILNMVNPIETLSAGEIVAINEVEGLPFSILNSVNPISTIPQSEIVAINEVEGLSFSILNTVSPIETLTAGEIVAINEVESLSFSILNSVNPIDTLSGNSINIINEVEGLPFSILNNVNPELTLTTDQNILFHQVEANPVSIFNSITVEE